jgi:integrase
MALAMARPWKHPKTGIFWLRKLIPDDLRPLLGKREEKQSLGTRDPIEAKRVHARALAELGERWANLRSGPTALTEREAHELVAPAYEWWVNAHRDNPSDQKIWKSERFGELGNYHDASKYTDLPFAERDRRMDEDGYFDLITMEAFCREKVEELLSQRGLKIEELSRQKIEKAFGAAIQRASLTLAKLANGQLDAPMGRPATTSHSEFGSQTAVPSDPVKFEMLVAGWGAERRPMPKTIYEYKRVMRALIGFLGHGDARRLSAKDLVTWKAKMIEAGLHPKTIRDAKLAPVRAILQWAVDNHLLPINPATRVTIDVKNRAGESKRGFDDAEAASILGAARREADPVKRWVPLLGAYSGARVSEICQLRVADITQLSGIWCMKIAPEAGSLKTAGSERVVPLHPAVIEAGFLQFVVKSAAGPLFSTLRPDVFGKRGGNGTKIIGRWVRGLGLTDARISPSHSWRHRVKTLGRRHGLMLDIVNAITGHHSKTVADSYGEFPIEALYRELSKIPPFGTL